MSDQLDNAPALIRSWSDEIATRINRVRNLIGNIHWPTDGRYKERIVAEFIAQRLPSRFKLDGGFVISPFVTTTRSREIDILIADSWKEPFPLCELGTLITYPNAAIAQIQVKTTFGQAEVNDVIDALGSSRFANAHIWSGGLFLETGEISNQALRNRLLSVLQHISDTKDVTRVPHCLCVLNGPFITFRVEHNDGTVKVKASVFTVGGLSFGIFLASLLQTIYATTLPNGGRLRLEELVNSLVCDPAIEEAHEFSL